MLVRAAVLMQCLEICWTFECERLNLQSMQPNSTAGVYHRKLDLLTVDLSGGLSSIGSRSVQWRMMSRRRLYSSMVVPGWDDDLHDIMALRLLFEVEDVQYTCWQQRVHCSTLNGPRLGREVCELGQNEVHVIVFHPIGNHPKYRTRVGSRTPREASRRAVYNAFRYSVLRLLEKRALLRPFSLARFSPKLKYFAVCTSL